MSIELFEFGQQNYMPLIKDYDLFFQNSPISNFCYAQFYLQNDKQKMEEDYFYFSKDLKWTNLRLSKDWSSRKSPINQILKSNKIYPYIWPTAYKEDDVVEALFHLGYLGNFTIYKLEGLKLHAFSFSISRDKGIDNISNFYFHELQEGIKSSVSSLLRTKLSSLFAQSQTYVNKHQDIES